MDFTAANAGRADSHAFAGAFDQSMNGLQVQIPAALRYVVGMTDAMPELRPSATNFTNFCHKNTRTLDSIRVGKHQYSSNTQPYGRTR